MNIATQRILFSFTLLAGLLLSALCIALPVLQWSSLANNTLIKYTVSCAALGLGICKLTFFPLAAWHLNQKTYLPAIVLFSMASIALIMSILATASLLTQLNEQKKQQAKTESADYQMTMRSINTLDNQINNINTLITHDIANNYRTRALQQQASVKALVAQRAQQVAALEQQKHSNHTHIKTGLDGQWQFNVANTLLTLSSTHIAAAALHVTGVLALLSISSWWPATTTTHSNIDVSMLGVVEHQAVSEPAGETLTEPANKPTNEALINALEADQKTLAHKIAHGEFGPAPVLRNIINDKERGIRGGYKRVKPVFNHLIEAGILNRQGRCYQVVQVT